jgi:hypothetical protein
MTQSSESSYRDGTEPLSGWAIGGITFAASMMTVIGLFQAIAGLAAILDDGPYVVAPNYVFDLDTTAWGWIHLLIGIAMLSVGFGLYARKVWAGMVAVMLAMLSAVVNFFVIPNYPFWSLLVIGLDVWVIWALTRPGAVRA